MHTPLRKNRAFGKIKKMEHWVLEYFKTNPITTITASLTFIGLLSIYAYHFHIEYSPAFDLESLASIIFSSAYVGLCLFIACGIVIFLPAIFIGAYLIPSGQPNTPAVMARIARLFAIAALGFYGLCLFVFLCVTLDLPSSVLAVAIVECLLIYLLFKKVF